MEGKAWSPARAASSSSVKIQIDFPCFTLNCVSRHTPIMDQLPSVAANVHLMPIFGFCSGKTPTIRSSRRSRKRGPKRCRDSTFVFLANTVCNEVAWILLYGGHLIIICWVFVVLFLYFSCIHLCIWFWPAQLEGRLRELPLPGGDYLDLSRSHRARCKLQQKV